MKIRFFIVAFLFSLAASSQAPFSRIAQPYIWTQGGFDNLFLPNHDTITPTDKTKAWMVLKGTALYVWNGTKWNAVSGPAGPPGSGGTGDPNNSGTVAQLRAMSTTAGKVYFSTDFGGGTWVDVGLYDGQFIDDGARYLTTGNNRVLKRVDYGNLDPVMFGADRTGAVSSTAAIQAAINAAATLSATQGPQDPGKIVLHDGTYRITGAGLTMPSGVSIEGNGRVTFLLDNLNIGAYAVSILNNSTTRKTTISGITFTDNSNAGNKNGILLTTHDNILVGNKFYNLNEGIKIDGFNGNIIKEDFFYGCKLAIYLYGYANQTYIERNSFFNGAANGVAAIKLNDANSPVPLTNVYISDNWYEGNNGIPNILGRNCNDIFITRFWSEDYAQTWTSPRVDIDQGTFPSGVITLTEGRFVVKAGTKAVIKINAASPSIKEIDIHQDNEIPTIDFVKSHFPKVERVRFASIEAETDGMGYGVNIKGGVKVTNEDVEESENKTWSVGGIQVRDGKNIIYDSEFKNGHHLVAGGAVNPTLALDNTTGAFDNTSAKVIFPAANMYGSNARHDKVIAASVGDNIRIAFWAKTNGAPHRIISRIAGEATLSGSDIYLTNKWNKFYIAVDSIPTAGNYFLYFETYGSAAPFTFWLDDIQAEIGPNVKDFSAYVPNATASSEVSFGKGIQLPTYYMGETKFDRGTSAQTDPNGKRASIRWNDQPINGAPVGWVTTTPGLARGFGQVENVDLNWVGKSEGVTENSLNGLTFSGGNTSFGNVARSRDVFTANAGMLTFKFDRTAYGANSQAMIGFTPNTTFTGWNQILLGVYWSPVGLNAISTAFGFSDVIPGVDITDYLRLRPTSTNTYIDKSTDGITWTLVYTPPIPIILSGDNYVGVDFNGTGGDKSINYITQSVNGEFDAKFILKNQMPFILRNALGTGIKPIYNPNVNSAILKNWQFTGGATVTEPNDSTVVINVNAGTHTGNLGFTADGSATSFTFTTTAITGYTVDSRVFITPTSTIGAAIDHISKSDESFTVYFTAAPTAGAKTLDYLITQ